jgi:predicted acetyltransferase
MLYIEKTRRKSTCASFFVMRHLRRKGIGRCAAEILLSELRPKTKRLIVEVLTQNQSAVAFWRAMGYNTIRSLWRSCRDADSEASVDGGEFGECRANW